MWDGSSDVGTIRTAGQVDRPAGDLERGSRILSEQRDGINTPRAQKKDENSHKRCRAPQWQEGSLQYTKNEE